MPWPVYSERFLHHQAAGTWTWTVPADMRAVVTNIDLVNYGAVGLVCAVLIGPIFAEYVVFQAANPVVHRQLRTVAYQGEVITMTLSGDGIHASVGGYLFADSSGRTGPPPGAGYKPVTPGRPVPANEVG
jgi:hypothetical protein